MKQPQRDPVLETITRSTRMREKTSKWGLKSDDFIVYDIFARI